MHSTLLLFGLVLGGSLISSLTGLGGGSLILAGLMLVYPPELAIPLHSFTQITANFIRMTFSFNEVRWKVVAYYAALMLPFAYAGVSIIDHINSSWLKVLVGVMILVSIVPFKFKPKGEASPKTFLWLGALSGFLGVFVGAVGPMVTPFFNRLGLSRNGNIATKSAGQMLLQLTKIIAFAGIGFNFGKLGDHIGILVAASFIGVMVSMPIGKKISDAKFDLIVNGMLLVISLKVIYEGVVELVR
jgi:uncharacterized protein